jgi:hypothetical protein
MKSPGEGLTGNVLRGRNKIAKVSWASRHTSYTLSEARELWKSISRFGELVLRGEQLEYSRRSDGLG